jgi:DnaK suppressor protein
MVDRTTWKANVRQMLRQRRIEVQKYIRARRTDRPKDVGDHLEESDANLQGDIDLTLLQMRAETMTQIDALLARLEADKYGRCVGCEQAIAEPRLRAMPLALRCQACEERREQRHENGRRLERRELPFGFFPSEVGP